jgi:hypothetical protein
VMVAAAATSDDGIDVDVILAEREAEWRGKLEFVCVACWQCVCCADRASKRSEIRSEKASRSGERSTMFLYSRRQSGHVEEMKQQ